MSRREEREPVKVAESRRGDRMQFSVGCFRKCYFGIPRNTEFYTELVLFRVIPRNFLRFNSAEFRGIPCRYVYTEFRIPPNENTIIEPITKDL
jgi:hypothetical protein